MIEINNKYKPITIIIITITNHHKYYNMITSIQILIQIITITSYNNTNNNNNTNKIFKIIIIIIEIDIFIKLMII